MTTVAMLEAFVHELVPGARQISIRRSEYSTSHVVEEVDVECTDGIVLPLILKRLGPEDLLPEAEGKRPRFLDDPSREPFVYRSILHRHDLGTAGFFGSRTDQAGGHWLLLERVDGIELFQVGDRRLWEGTARWLANMHLIFAPDARSRAASRLVRYDADFYRRWPERALRFHPQHRQALARLTDRWDELVERLLAMPSTVIHGELYASNVIVAPGTRPSDGGTRRHPFRVCAIDWEMAAVGPGLADLAALTSGWENKDREAIARAYHDELRLRGAGPSFAELWSGLADCRMYLCLQWLGWASGWVPPPEQENDWLADALTLAEGMGW